MTRDALLAQFLRSTDWADRTPSPLAGDASNRRYLRVSGSDDVQVVIMDAPPEKGEDIAPFCDVTKRLQRLKFSAPSILASDYDNGFLVLEDLGDDLFARILASDISDEFQLYAAATDVLVHLHRHPETAVGLPAYDIPVYVREANLITDWYVPMASGNELSAQPTQAFETIIKDLCNALENTPPVCVLRDYHAENLIWLPAREGLARVGLLDYQDALAGHRAYDLVSLLEDARRDISLELQNLMLERYIDATGVDQTEFRRAYAILGAQRNLKILGIFARLGKRDGKPVYMDLMPRVWAHLQNDLRHPDLSALKDWVAQHVPAPAPDILRHMAAAV